MARRMLNNFVNLSKNGLIHQNLQPSWITRDLKDVRSVIDLHKFTFVNIVEESNLINLSGGIVLSEAIRRGLENAYDKGKVVRDTFTDCRLVSLTKLIYDPIMKHLLIWIRKWRSRLTKEFKVSSQSKIFGKIAVIAQFWTAQDMAWPQSKLF